MERVGEVLVNVSCNTPLMFMSMMFLGKLGVGAKHHA